MSNRPSFTRAKKAANQQPLELEVVDLDGETLVLQFKSKLHASTLEAVGRAQNGDVSGMFDALKSMCLTDSDYQSALALDLDIESDDLDADGNPTNELSQFMAEVMKLYGDPGKSGGSSTSSSDGGTSSKPTSAATTASTSPTLSGVPSRTAVVV